MGKKKKAKKKELELIIALLTDISESTRITSQSLAVIAYALEDIRKKSLVPKTEDTDVPYDNNLGKSYGK